MIVHLSTVVWSHLLWERMYSLCLLLHMTVKTEVCLWARFSHAVWSCLKRWREEQPHPSSTEPESVFSGISAECWCAFPREWLNMEEMSERERETEEIVSTLSDLREPMAGQIFPGRRGLQERWVSKYEQGCNHSVNRRWFNKWKCSYVRMRGVWRKGEDPRSSESRGKVEEWSQELFSLSTSSFFFWTM